jgi:hypothetical protein
MPRIRSRATGHAPALLLAAGLLLVPAAVFAQAHWIRISDPPDPPSFAEGTAVYDSIGDRVIVYRPFSPGDNSNPFVSDEIWEFRLGEPDQGWHQLAVSGTGPGGRSGSSVVFDPQGQRMLLYGGWVPLGVGTMSNDIFVLSLAGPPAWSVIHADAVVAGSMPVRLGAIMCLDETSRRLVVYGGSARFPDLYRPVFDVWTLPLDSPPSWTQIPITGGVVPPVRYDAQFAWDPARSRLLMHGGSKPPGGAWDDTWALTVGNASAHWDPLATTGLQVARVRGGALVDAPRDRMLLAPGSTTIPAASDRTVYELPLAPGGEWAPVEGTQLFHSGMDIFRVVGDSRRQRMLTVGYTFADAFAMADASGWQRQWPPDPVHQPGLLTGQQLVSDAEHRAIWSVGGSERGGFDGLWKLDVTAGAPWTWYPQEEELPYEGHGAALDPDGQRIMVTSLKYRSEVIALGTDGTPTETVWTPRDTFPQQRTDYPTVIDPVRRRLLLFGGNYFPGYSFGYSLGDLWSLSLDDPSAWTPLAPAGAAPPARQGHFAFYDDVRDRMVMLGGVDQNGGPIRHSVLDAWSLALTGAPAWTTLDAAAWVPPVPGVITYDPVTRRMFLFHPSSPGSPPATQVYARGIADDDRWTLVPTSGEAPVFQGPVAFASWADRLVVASTTATGPMPDETWALPLEHVQVTNATLESARKTSARVALTWRLDGVAAAPLTVSRRSGDAPWEVVAHPLADGDGRVVFEDIGVAAGADIRYRLKEGARTLFEESLHVPAVSPLALAATRPSPARGTLNVVFALPVTSPVKLELFDVHGARVLERDLGLQQEGEHTWGWQETATLRPGIYLVRLISRGQTRETKAVLLP